MRSVFQTAFLCLCLCHLKEFAEAHGYLRHPSSRNTIPGATVEPQSANTGGVCGTITSGSPNFNDAQWISEGGTFTAGQTFQAEVVITAHHKGHFEFRLCTNPSDLTQNCFDQHVLSRAASSPTASPLDPQYPGRWYLPPGSGSQLMEFLLPADVSCDRCVLQWTYITANSCVPRGYKSFFTASDAAGLTTPNWHMGWMGSGDDGTCGGREDSQFVGGAPEKFWSCSDIKILPCESGDCTAPPTSPPPPTVTLAPSPPWTEPPTGASTASPTTSTTTAPPSPPSDGSCASNCDSCVAIPGNPQSAQDEACAPCANGQAWWPCNVEGLCKCASGTPATDTPTSAPTATPTAVTTPPPTDAPTGAPMNNCASNCASCVSVSGNCANATHAMCAPCAQGQFWWPCNIQGACECAQAATASPTASVTLAPTTQVTAAPSVEVTMAPTTGVTSSPSAAVTAAPTTEVTPAPTPSTTPPSGGGGGGGESKVIDVLKAVDWTDILRAQQPDLSWAPSSIYKSADLILAVEKMMTVGVGEYTMLAGEGDQAAKYALVNIAAFLAQSMHETIQYDACDENNWDSTSGYTAANACGQLGQSYQNYQCSPDEAYMQCDVDPSMEVLATTHAKWYGAPAPFFCGPKTKVPKAPKWSTGGWCDPQEWPSWQPWATAQEFFDALAAGETCKDYQNQKAGQWVQCSGEGCPNAAAPNFGEPARTDVEGCCWWGRGVIQTTGVCNFGKLNYYAGARAAREGRTALFGDVDFCRNPGEICESKLHPDLKWVAGMFYWTKEVQGYPTVNSHNFDYLAELQAFTDAGNIGDSSFIDKCSGIVNRGCPSRTSCAAGAVHEVDKRAANFRTVLTAFGFPWASRRASSPMAALPARTPAHHSCASSCAECVSVFKNQASATDQHCAACATGQTEWPCNMKGVCTCIRDRVDPL
eukprot:TRINITY_DN330_c0_g1_i1.p1 TRINITY_DN330_c0_g1~~TRINITY_DN330_c0_g1_i1.p1  ORF type:complete len:931 (+),score=199.88 TRINITY_DN330_c0_g1_i1:188-2980(+)